METLQRRYLQDLQEEKTRVLFVTPHLSTGGCPQYLLKKIETYQDVLEIYVIEYNFLGDAYVVQRNRIREIVDKDKFFSLGDDKRRLLSLIEKIRPEIIHFEETPETFVDIEMLDHIYTNKDRDYFISETTHSSMNNPDDKRFIPDKFIFCSPYSQAQFAKLEVPSEVWEYPIEKKERPDRQEALKKLGLDPSYTHILNVGLFTSGKNQGELFAIASQLRDLKVQFHFVGNQAENFKNYWEPLMKVKPDNCRVWGERADVENFMSACDIFYFSSVFELNPLVVKEAISWGLPVFMRNLHTYMNAYDNEPLVTYLRDNMIDNSKILRSFIEKSSIVLPKRAKIVHILSELDSEIERTSVDSVSKLCDKDIEYTIHYNPPTTEIPLDRDPLYSRDEIGKNLKPGHFGCFEAFRKAITEDFTDDYDFVIVCERDCILEKPTEEIKDLLNKTFFLMEEEDIPYFSFGDKVDLGFSVLQSDKVADLPVDFAYLTNRIIGLQFVIFSRKGRDFLRRQFKERGWHGMDIWFNVVFNEANLKMGILEERVTTQIEGFSLIDNTEKKFLANKK